jgi:predicted P-loop ATPase
MPIDIGIADEFDRFDGLDNIDGLNRLCDRDPASLLGPEPTSGAESRCSADCMPLNDRLCKELAPATLAEYQADQVTIRSALHRQSEDDDTRPAVSSIDLGLEWNPRGNSIDPDDRELLDEILDREQADEDDGKQGRILKSSWNLSLVIAKSSICRGLAWCNLRQSVVWTDQAPDWVTPGQRITSSQVVEIGNLVSRYFEMTWSPKAIDEQIQAVARRTILEPVQDWLKETFAQELRSERGIQDPSDWLIRFCGAEDNLVNRMIGRWWLVSVVARSMKPGTKVDHMLVLQGSQASRKTSMVYALMPRKDWVCELTSNLDTTDGVRQLDGRVLAFDDELKRTRKKSSKGNDEEDVKSFLTRQQDQIRTMYSPRFETTKRRVTFIGSCNPDEFLSDPTGNRRYWPVKITHCDDKRIEENRDALWAGAYGLWLLGERFWPETAEEIAALKDRADEVTQQNPWAADYLHQAKELFRQSQGAGVELKEVYEAFKGANGSGQKGSEISHREAREIGDILRAAGWQKERKMSDAIRRVYWLPPTATAK